MVTVSRNREGEFIELLLILRKVIYRIRAQFVRVATFSAVGLKRPLLRHLPGTSPKRSSFYGLSYMAQPELFLWLRRRRRITASTHA